MKLLKDIFTSRDNSTFSMSKLIAIGAACGMIFEFLKTGSVDFQGFGIGVASVIGALAAKSFTDK